MLPLLIYALLRPLLASDIVALAFAAAVPALRTLALWVWRRRVDWIGLHAVLGFGLALAGYLETDLVEFPGNHAGFSNRPKQFAGRLHELLIG